MTVSLSAARRLAATRWSTSKASLLAAWLDSSSETRPRKKSEDRISVALKCWRAKVDLPLPEGPMRRTRANSGMEIFIAGQGQRSAQIRFKRGAGGDRHGHLRLPAKQY